MAMVFGGCATTNSAGNKQADSSYEDLLYTLGWYAMAASAPYSLTSASDGHSEDFLDALFQDFIHFAAEEANTRVNADVQAALCSDKETLNKLFMIKEDEEFDVNLSIRKIQIFCPPSETIAPSRSAHRVFDAFGKPEIECHFKDSIQQAEALVEIQLTLSPDDIPSKDWRFCTARLFKITRRLHLVRSEHWKVMSSEQGTTCGVFVRR